ncbi:MAG TPA: NAD(P)-binding protein [Actinomycetota bacterium]|nr:NAD(P)-binding protein [Actinomycetota bacterium]
MGAGQGQGRERKDGITRREFLDGVAVTAAGLAIAAAKPWLTGAEAMALAAERGAPQPPGPLPSDYYPPIAVGLKGQPDGMIAEILKIDGPPNPDDVHSVVGGPGIKRKTKNTGEVYDCVIVGAGASGLAAAKFYRDRFGPNSKILILDAQPDFGGHSHRNEFHIPDAGLGGGDTMLLRNGGTVNLDSIGTWGRPSGAFLDVPPNQAALEILAFCGVDPNNFPSTTGPGIPSSYGLRPMLLFPAEDWGTDVVARARFEPNTVDGWTAYVNRLPYSQAAKDAIVRIQTDTTTDWIALKHGPGMTPEQRVHLLTTITYKQWLMDYLGAPEEAIIEYQRGSHGLLGAGAQATSAADNWMLGRPGFSPALGLPDPEVLADNGFPGIGRTPQMDNMSNSGPTRLWPDGNSSLLRLLVSKLIPDAFPDGPPNQENVILARLDYSKLDQPSNDVRIRLNSLVFQVKPAERRNDLAKVEYEVLDGPGAGQAFFCHAKHVIMACWNRVTARVVKGLPAQQIQDLCYARKVPLIYGRAGLRNWQAFADAQVLSVTPRGPSLFWDSTTLVAGARFGSVYGPTPNTPDRPAILQFNVVPTGHDTTPQLAAYEVGRQKLLEMTFEELESALFDVIDRTVNRLGGDFDPERDVESIMINRWNYGYAHELTSVWDPAAYGPFADQPQVRGRAPFRNVAIANSDSQAFAYTHSAIQEGYRAVQDLPA